MSETAESLRSRAAPAEPVNPLDADGTERQAHIEASVNGVARLAAQHLSRADTAAQALSIVEVLHQNVDKTVIWAKSPGLSAACREGCSHCCSSRVEVSEPEALLMAAHVQSLPAADQSRLRSKLQAKSAHHQSQASADHQRVFCAFLENERCSIYALRPSTCRKGHSLSAQACEQRAEVIPQDMHVLLQCEILMAGTARALQAHGLSSGRHELSQAVLAALSAGQAAQAWFEGAALMASQAQA